MSRFGIVNVRMVITEEKILSNISKVQKMIDPNSKKQIIQLEDDAYFKDLVESIKTYLIEYPKKKNFPSSVYKAAYELVEFATSEFEENTKQIEDLIRQRESNIALAAQLKEALDAVLNKTENWKETVKGLPEEFSEDIKETLGVLGRAKSKKSQNYQDALKLIKARIANLESNLHIEIDMERIEDRSKALSYIGIEVADALKLIPAPQENFEAVEDEVQENVEEIEEIEEAPKAKVKKAKKEKKVKEDKKVKTQIMAEHTVQEVQEIPQIEEDNYYEETRVEVKPSLWQRFKASKFVRTIKYIMKIRIVLEVPALPSADEQSR